MSASPPSSGKDAIENTVDTVSDERALVASGSSAPRKVFVSAIHAYLYTLPTYQREILYISKVDSSGYLPTPISISKALILSFITYHLRPDVARGTRVQVQLFARSQAQYLFPNSSKAPRKRVAGGLGLCGWWKGVYEGAARAHLERYPGSLSVKAAEDGHAEGSNDAGPSSPSASLKTGPPITLRYLLPSYSEAEAKGMLGAPRHPLPNGVEWTYGPPFTLPIDRHAGLALTIPSLTDDPKTRFLEELVSESGRHLDEDPDQPGRDQVGDTNGQSTKDGRTGGPALTPQSSTATLVDSPKKSKPSVQSSSRHTLREKDKERDESDRKAAETALWRITPEEFWERMGFRQECASGDVTGFFSLELEPMDPENVAPKAASSRGIGQFSPSATLFNDDGTESTKGEGSHHSAVTVNGSIVGGGGVSSNSSTSDISPELVDRLLKALLNTDFATLELATEGSESWMDSARGIVVGEIGQQGWEECVGIVRAKEGVAAIEKKRKEEIVTMLQPRKKKKA